MSTSRKGRTEAALRLDSLSRRELQALCKEHGIPTKKTNAAMADSLSACVPVDCAKPKAWAGVRVPKTTPLEPKMDGAPGLPETFFTSSGKWNVSPVEPSVADRADASFLKPTSTPLRRGMKRSERSLIQTPRENRKATFSTAFSRAAALVDRYGNSAAATSTHRPQAPTPGKRSGRVVENVARRGGDAHPHVSCTEIEFRNAALHKELFGVRSDQDVIPVEEGPEPRVDLSAEIGFEFRDMALHKELLGSNATINLVPSEVGVFNSPLTSSPEILDYSGHDIRVLSSIREEEDTSDGSGRNVEPIERHQGSLLADSPTRSCSRTEQANIQTSPLATPLTKIRNNLDCTLTKATSILEKLAALRADAEKKRRDGYWETEFSTLAENASPVAVFRTPLVVDRDLPSAKKARRTPKALASSEKGFVVCEDADISTRNAKTVRFPDESRDSISDKENPSELKRKEDGNPLGKQKKNKQSEVLKDHSTNSSNDESTQPEVRPDEMSLRKLRAQFKERIRHLEASKASDLRPWSERAAWDASL